MQAELLVLNAAWTAIIAGVRPPQFIGSQVAPWAPCDFVSGIDINLYRVNPAAALKIESTAVGRYGNLPVFDMEIDRTQFQLTDYGRQVRTGVAEEGLFNGQFNGVNFIVPPLGDLRLFKLKNAAANFWFEHEVAVRNMVHTSAFYDAGLVFNVGDPIDAVNAPNGAKFVAFDDPDANPIQSIQRLCDAPLIPGNTAVMGLSVWRALERNKALNSYVRGIPGIAQTESGLLTEAQFASAFGLEKVIVGKQRVNLGTVAAPKYARVWKRDFAIINVAPPTLTTAQTTDVFCLSPFGKMQFQIKDAGSPYGNAGDVVNPGVPLAIVSNYLKPGEENAGIRGCWQDCMFGCRGVASINKNAGALINDCVSNDV